MVDSSIKSFQKDSSVHFKNIMWLALIIICVHFLGLKGHFMLDDFGFINKSGFSQKISSVKDTFTEKVSQHYSPVYKIVNMMLFRVFDQPLYFRAMNLILFLFNALLFYSVTFMLSKDSRIAFLSAVLFSIHPLNADNLSHNVFAPLFLMGMSLQVSFVLFWKYQSHETKKIYYVLSLVFFGFSLLCYEFATTFPLLLVCALYFLTKNKISNIFKMCLPYFILSFSYAVLWYVKSVDNVQFLKKIEMADLNFVMFLELFSRLCGWYLYNIVNPNNIVAIYNLPLISQNAILWIGFLIALFVILPIYLLTRKRQHQLAVFALVWFLIGFILAIPASVHYVTLMGMVIEPYWFFFWSMGIFFLIAIGFVRLSEKINKKIVMVLFCSVSIFFVIETQRQHLIAQTEIGYAENWLRNSPGNLFPMMILSTLYTNNTNIPIPEEFVEELQKVAYLYALKGDHQRAKNIILRLEESERLNTFR